MEFDRDLAVQVGITVAVVGLFVAGLVVISGEYGGDVPANETLEGGIDGNYEGDLADGTVTFDGTFENDIEADVDGTITADDEAFATGRFEGNISGAIDGTLNGTLTDIDADEDAATVQAGFEGTANGTTGMDLTEQGGVALLGLVAGFIVLMPVAGYLIRRLREDED